MDRNFVKMKVEWCFIPDLTGCDTHQINFCKKIGGIPIKTPTDVHSTLKEVISWLYKLKE